MNIFIAKDYHNEPLSLILSDSYDKAVVAFSAMNIGFNSIEEINPNNELGMGGVCFVLNSTEYSKHDIDHKNNDFKFRIWKRGL